MIIVCNYVYEINIFKNPQAKLKSKTRILSLLKCFLFELGLIGCASAEVPSEYVSDWCQGATIFQKNVALHTNNSHNNTPFNI